MATPTGRRPLKVRHISLAKHLAQWLSQKDITPNQISMVSVLFAALASACLLLVPIIRPVWLPAVLAALFIQCRLLCNLFDGMVAVEGGKGTRSGELFNDMPDRFADVIILVAAGYATDSAHWGIALGWCAGVLAVMTAYVRTLAASLSAPINFSGPMAKQHRMAVITVACLLTAFESGFWPLAYSLFCALLLIVAGCVITLYRRTLNAYRYLEQTDHV